MSFDAGAITGTLGLDLSAFTSGITQAVQATMNLSQGFDGPAKQMEARASAAGSHIAREMGHAAAECVRAFAPVAGEIGAVLGTGLQAVAGEALGGLMSAMGSVTRAIGSAFAALGKAIAEDMAGATESVKDAFKSLLDAAVKTAETILDVFKHTGKELAATNAAAFQAGLDPSYFSGMSGAFEAAGASATSFGDSIKFLNRNAAEAASGNEELRKSFEGVGVSAEFVQSHLNDTRALFEAAADGIAHMGSRAEQTQAAMSLLGRGGADALTAIAQGSEELKKFAALYEDVGGVVTKEQARLGERFEQMSTLVKGAWDGIARAFSQPILEYIDEHFDELQQLITQVAGVIRENLGSAMEQLKPHLGEIISAVTEALAAISELAGPLIGIFTAVVRLIADVVNGIGGMVSGVQQLTGAVAPGYDPNLRNATNVAGSMRSGEGGGGGGGGGGPQIGEVNIHLPPPTTGIAEYDEQVLGATIAKHIGKALDNAGRRSEIANRSAAAVSGGGGGGGHYLYPRHAAFGSLALD